MIERILEKGDDIIKKAYDAAEFLQSDSFNKRIVAGIALKLMGSTLEELKQQYDIQEPDLN